MCYSALVKRDLKYLEENFGIVMSRIQLDAYTVQSKTDPKLFPPLADRIFPGNFAPVGHLESKPSQLGATFMRYSVDPPGFISTPSRYTTFNARRDNLTSKFWSDAFMKHHGFIVLEAFYEWVDVKDLLSAGVVTIKEITQEFERQAAVRRSKLEAQGKPYKPTPTELKNPRFRKIIIEFRPDGHELLVPVIYSTNKQRSGFAIVTQDPPPEISDAGHDRCPVFLERSAIEDWLSPRGKTVDEMQAVLDRSPQERFYHRLPEAA